MRVAAAGVSVAQAQRMARHGVAWRGNGCHVMSCAYLSRSLGAKRASSVKLSLLVMLLERRLDCEKRAAMGESAGRGLRRTGDCTAVGTGCDDVWERKVAKD